MFVVLIGCNCFLVNVDPSPKTDTDLQALLDIISLHPNLHNRLKKLLSPNFGELKTY